MIDPDTFKQRCLTRPCNITAKLERGNELLVIANDTKVPVSFTAELGNIDEKHKFPGWLVIVFFVLVGLIVFLFPIAIWRWVKCRKAYLVNKAQNKYDFHEGNSDVSSRRGSEIQNVALDSDEDDKTEPLTRVN